MILDRPGCPARFSQLVGGPLPGATRSDLAAP
jgi:hypothetical protein